MEGAILIGIQGSGKITFYRERFSETHVRISLDERPAIRCRQHAENQFMITVQP